MKKLILITVLNFIYFITPLLAMEEEEGKRPILETQRIRFIPNKEEGVEWTKENVGDSDHDGFIISVTREKEDPLTVVCLNMMAFTTMKHTYGVNEVEDENNITSDEAKNYKYRLNKIAATLAIHIEGKKNLVFVLQEMRQSDVTKGKFFDDGVSNAKFRDFFVAALESHTNKEFIPFSKSTVTNTFSNLIIVEEGLDVEERKNDNLSELDGLKTGERTSRADLIKSGHADATQIKTQKDQALGVEINGIEVYGLHLLHHKYGAPTRYEPDLHNALTQIFQRKRNEEKPMLLIGDFNFDLKNMRLPEGDGLSMGYMLNGALDGKGNKNSIDGYIASSGLSVK